VNDPAADPRPSRRAIVLVEGASDAAALETLARRRERDLHAEGVAVVAMEGATNIGRFLERYGPDGEHLHVAGLCDEAEEPDFRRALERAAFGDDLTRDAMERLGFFVCVRDLEDELIRALGAEIVQRVLDEQGELPVFRTFQRQPEWRGRPVEEQLRRFIGTRSGRKIRLGGALVEALDLDRVPRPLDAVLESV
jgi:hypothetical protein